MVSADHSSLRSAALAASAGRTRWPKGPDVMPLINRPAARERPVSDDESCDWWFTQDPLPRFVVNDEGRLLSANPAGDAALLDGRLTANGAGVLKFGSAGCDASFAAAVRAVAGKGAHCRLVLRQRHGGWFGAGLHGSRTEPLVVVALREELTPDAEALAAIGAAFRLTASELDVLECLLSGQCPKTAATDLSISEHTVRAHLRSIYAKMNARGLSNVIRLSCSFL